MIREIRIERELFVENRSLDTIVEITNGKIISVRGIMGITQYEDEIPIMIREDNMFRLPLFIWHHYFALIFKIEGDENTRILFKDKNDCVDIGFYKVGEIPQTIRIKDKAGFCIFLHSFVQTGSLNVTPKKVTAGSKEKLKITYTAGKNGLSEGSSVLILTPPTCWSYPSFNQTDNFTVKSNNMVEFYVELNRMNHRGNIYKVTAVKGGLNAGESFTIDYTGENGEGVTVQRYIQDKVFFIGLEGIIGGVLTPLPLSNCAPVKVVAGIPCKYRIKTAQIINPDDEPDINVRALDICRNPTADYNGEARLEISGLNGILYETNIKFIGGFSKIKLGAMKAGNYVLSVAGENFESEYITVSVREPGADSLYFGELHGHSAVSDGLFGMRDYFDYGKNIGMLDFCALSDHDWEIVEHSRNRENGGLKALGEITAEYNKPGEFVTFCGYEWMGIGGHINVYYLSDKNNPVYVGMITILGNDNLCPTMEGFIRQYEGRDDVLIIPHISHGFEFRYFDAKLEPVVEMYSQWGCSEQKCATQNMKGAVQFLNDGLRFGFISGADTHHGMPGQTGDNSKYYMLSHREGLTGVYAGVLERCDIFNSIKNKKTYATDGERILLDFSVNGYFMGSEAADISTDFINANIFIGGTKRIEKIEIICRGTSVWEKTHGNIIEELSVSIPRYKGENEYYYLRVTQSDGSMAWSSPIWMN
jgi:Predicted metal-dependent phosphoesterases (PHP family)